MTTILSDVMSVMDCLDGITLVPNEALRNEKQNAGFLAESSAISYVGINLRIPPVAEHILAYAKQKDITPLKAVREVRESKHAVAFRIRCSEIEDEMRNYGKRSSFRNMQKLLQEIDTLTKIWAKDCDEKVRYKTRTIPLGSMWGIGGLLESVGLKEIKIKDPVIYESQPAMLFLNDLYRSPS